MTLGARFIQLTPASGSRFRLCRQYASLSLMVIESLVDHYHWLM
jgi:hypothetical protein